MPETNGRSLQFVKNQIESGSCLNMDYSDFDSIEEIDFASWIKENACESNDNTWSIEFMSEENSEEVLTRVDIEYNPEAAFEYFTMESCTCDGTLGFYRDLINSILKKLLTGSTSDRRKTPSDLNENPYGYNRKYIVGDIVMAHEYNDKFATKEKPWLRSRLSAMLPISMEFTKR